MSWHDIVIERITDGHSSLYAVDKFIREIAFASHKATPPPGLPEFLFAGVDRHNHERVLGTMGFDLGHEGRPTSIGKNWKANFPCEWGDVAQLGRWMRSSDAPRFLPPSLINVAAITACTHGRKLFVCELQPKIRDSFTRYGCKPRLVEHTELIEVNIEASGLPYYTPRPGIYTMEVDTVLRATMSYVPGLKKLIMEV